MNPLDAMTLVASVAPGVYSGTNNFSEWVNAGQFHGFLIIHAAGTTGGSSEQTMVVQEATDSSGAGAKTLYTGPTYNSSSQNGTHVLSLLTEALDVNGGFDHIRVQLQAPEGQVDGGIYVFGYMPRTGEPDDLAMSSLLETVRENA